MSDTAPQQSGLKILVVDNDRAFHDVVIAAAKRLPGAEVLCCRSPGEAIHKLDQFAPTLMIVDGLLNGAAGINFVKRVRAGHTPAFDGTLLVFVARDFTGGLSGRMCEAGCHGIVRKPVLPDALARALLRTLDSPVPFVLGGSYLGPDRRAPGVTEARAPERRGTPARGGWTGTPALFYRPDQPRPPVRRPPVTSAARATASAATNAAAGAAPGNGPATPAPSRAAPSAVPRGPSGPIEPATPQRPAAPSDGGGLEPAAPRPPARPATRPVEPARSPEAATPAGARTGASVAAQRPGGPPAARAPEAAAPAAAQNGGNEFDLDAAVRRHREWMASNGSAGARANLAGLSLAGAVLKGQNLAKANLRGTNLMNADLRSSVLVDADLRNACLAQAMLDEAQLAGAKIRHADLQMARLPLAGLQGSDLAGADLRGASLAGADLAGANLLGTNIRGADVTAVNLTQKQLDRASGDATTQLPPGLFVGRSDT